ncbi:pyridoxal phosphate-dependent transferase [Lipomyces doorenjongii]|uniref:pyridoxal phosphate-dependent transferase n=1 Tax=Lipomyces doorenjongii TaxID=383834 RepID=UPI0034CEF56D
MFSYQQAPLGHPMLEHFLLDPNYKNLNHGSFGTYPAVVRDQLRKFQDMAEARPDEFIRYTYPTFLDASRAAMAKYLNAPVNEIVFVKSATAAINTVLRNLTYCPRDVIIYFSTIFDACEKTIISITETTSLEARKVDSTFPITHKEIVRRFLDTLQKAKSEGFNVRICLFDTIVSLPGVRFPFERLVDICREQGVLSCIDGAHGVGHIPLDLSKLGADFFVSISHKWLYNPRGCSVFHVPIRNQHLIRTTIPTSHGFIPKDSPAQPYPNDRLSLASKSAFEKLFERVAVTDDASYLTIPAALEFRREILGGENRIFAYIEGIARDGGDLVATILGTEVLTEPNDGTIDQSEIRRCAFANVRLPVTIHDPKCSGGSKSISAYMAASHWPIVTMSQASEVVSWFQAQLITEFSTCASVFIHNGALWVRLSGQTYLELEDFKWLAEVLKELSERVGGSDVLKMK